MVTKKDLIYVIIIMFLLFSVVGFATIMFYDSEKAVLGISVASTLISIILAVLAIIYTYVDSSAQKESSAQLRTSAEKFAQSIEEEKEIITQFSEQLRSVTVLKDELLAVLTDNQEWRARVIDQLETLAQKEPQQTTIDINEVKKVMSQQAENQNIMNHRDRVATIYQRNRIMDALNIVLDPDNPKTFSSIHNELESLLSMQIYHEELQGILNRLVSLDRIKRAGNKYTLK